MRISSLCKISIFCHLIVVAPTEYGGYALNTGLRYKAVVAYERLKSWKGAANEVGKSVRYVKTWVGRHRAGMSLADKKRAGRPTLGLV